MSQELIYTSAPRGLKPGSHGFCTVVSTQGMPPVLLQRLESLSGYRHIFAPQDANARLNPVLCSHLILNVSGRRCHVLSRVCDAGLDHTQRTNKFAHHVVLDPREVPPAGPAWLLASPGFMQSTWDGVPKVLPAGRKPPAENVSPAICLAWQQATGDAGWGGVLAETAAANRPAIIVFSPGFDPLPLLAESLALLPPERRWNVSFSTYYSKLPPGVDCQWRCVVEGSPEALSARLPGALLIDLANPGRAPETALANAARTGVMPLAASPPQRQPAVAGAYRASDAELAQLLSEAAPAATAGFLRSATANRPEDNISGAGTNNVGPPPLDQDAVNVSRASRRGVPGKPRSHWWLIAGLAATVAILIVGIVLRWPKPEQPIAKESIESPSTSSENDAPTVDAAEKAAAEKAEREKAEREKAEREKAEREKAEREKAEREKAEREKAEKERVEKEKVEKEKVEKEEAEKEKADKEKAEKEKAEKETAIANSLRELDGKDGYARIVHFPKHEERDSAAKPFPIGPVAEGGHDDYEIKAIGDTQVLPEGYSIKVDCNKSTKLVQWDCHLVGPPPSKDTVVLTFLIEGKMLRAQWAKTASGKDEILDQVLNCLWRISAKCGQKIGATIQLGDWEPAPVVKFMPLSGSWNWTKSPVDLKSLHASKLELELLTDYGTEGKCKVERLSNDTAKPREQLWSMSIGEKRPIQFKVRGQPSLETSPKQTFSVGLQYDGVDLNTTGTTNRERVLGPAIADALKTAESDLKAKRKEEKDSAKKDAEKSGLRDAIAGLESEVAAWTEVRDNYEKLAGAELQYRIVLRFGDKKRVLYSTEKPAK